MNPYLLNVLPLSPSIFQRLYALLNAEQLDQPTVPGRFTPRQVIAHLADWEPINRGRMQAALDEDGTSVPDWDEEKMARQHRYEELDIEAQLRTYAEERQKTVAFLEATPREDWGKGVVHETRGAMTIYDMANLMIGHDLYHIEQITGVVRR